MSLDKQYLFDTILNTLSLPIKDLTIKRLQGDASDRQYFRLNLFYNPITIQIDRPNSIIVMKLKTPVINQRLSFIEMLSFLNKCELMVPKLYYYDQNQGILFLGDFGDITLEYRIKGQPIEIYRTFYRKAIDDLLKLQIIGTKNLTYQCPAAHLHFDVEKLMWEFRFFIEFYIERLKKIKLNKTIHKTIEECFLNISQFLDNQPKYLTHRDYHSRNLMILGDQIGILDFQDARMGPCQYDLTSLLKDSYVLLEDNFIEEMIDYYKHNKEQMEGRRIDDVQFRKVFDYMSIQRNLKAVSTFAYQAVDKKNTRYLAYIPNTLGYVRSNLNKYEELNKLRDILTPYLD